MRIITQPIWRAAAEFFEWVLSAVLTVLSRWCD